MENTNPDRTQEKIYIINHIKFLLDQLIELENSETLDGQQNGFPDELSLQASNHKPGVPVMLTVKECAEQFECLKEFTIRCLVKNNKVNYVRVGDTGRGRILVNKDSVVEYLESQNGKKNKA